VILVDRVNEYIRAETIEQHTCELVFETQLHRLPLPCEHAEAVLSIGDDAALFVELAAFALGVIKDLYIGNLINTIVFEHVVFHVMCHEVVVS